MSREDQPGSCFSAAFWEQAGWEDAGLRGEIPQIGTTCATNRLAWRQLPLLQGNLAGLPPRPSCFCAALSVAPCFISRLAGLPMWAGGSAPRGHVCYVSRKPLQKNILETQRFPFCRHTNEPQTEPTSKRPANEPVSPPSPPWFQEGPNDAAV